MSHETDASGLLARIPPALEAGSEAAVDDGAIGQSIPERFEQQVRAHANRQAIRWTSGHYNYAELNATANRLAQVILSRREASAEPIALLFDHGGDAIAAMLGVLKAAACYVVLDPGYPRERLTYMLNDSGASIIVASGGNLELARGLAGDRVEVIPFDSADARYSDANPGLYPRPDDLALLIYTSGSTGQPKAVMHSHQNCTSRCPELRAGLEHHAGRSLAAGNFDGIRARRALYLRSPAQRCWPLPVRSQHWLHRPCGVDIRARNHRGPGAAHVLPAFHGVTPVGSGVLISPRALARRRAHATGRPCRLQSPLRRALCSCSCVWTDRVLHGELGAHAPWDAGRRRPGTDSGVLSPTRM